MIEFRSEFAWLVAHGGDEVVATRRETALLISRARNRGEAWVTIRCFLALFRLRWSLGLVWVSDGFRQLAAEVLRPTQLAAGSSSAAARQRVSGRWGQITILDHIESHFRRGAASLEKRVGALHDVPLETPHLLTHVGRAARRASRRSISGTDWFCDARPKREQCALAGSVLK